MELKDVMWLTGRDCIGIVATENEFGEKKFYIGVVDGYDEEGDVKKIMDWGTRIPENTLIDFINRNKSEK